MGLDSKIEAVLFFLGEPTKIKKLAEFLDAEEDDVRGGLDTLERSLHNRGIVLLRKEDEVELRTAPEASELIEKITKEELVRDLGKAGLETLSIVLYKGPVSRREIDYIRGVNSAFILRNLLIRGLIEKVTNPEDQRAFLYKPTFELFSFLGITKREEMPEWSEVEAQLQSWKEEQEHESNKEQQEHDGGE